MSYAPMSRFSKVTGAILLFFLLIGFALAALFPQDSDHTKKAGGMFACVVIPLMILFLISVVISEFRHMFPSLRKQNPAYMASARIKNRQLISLSDRDTKSHIGDVTGKQMRPLVRFFENWRNSPNNFPITPETTQFLRDAGLDISVISLLEGALEKSQTPIVLRWEKKKRKPSFF